MKKMVLLLIIALFSMILFACSSDDTSEENSSNKENEEIEETNHDYAEDVTENPVVTITMESGEKIVAELYPKIAPNTVANFVSLAEKGFYDGVIFHRVIPGFMIQGGDPTGTGRGGPDYSIDGEFTDNGFENSLLHERGVISMARAQDPNSAGSQFFIMVETVPQLDGQYAAFGKVIEGMEAVDQIVSVETDASDKPFENQTIQSVVVDTKGFDYPQPVKNK